MKIPADLDPKPPIEEFRGVDWVVKSLSIKCVFMVNISVLAQCEADVTLPNLSLQFCCQPMFLCHPIESGSVTLLWIRFYWRWRKKSMSGIS